jgi:hypothetical protein
MSLRAVPGVHTADVSLELMNTLNLNEHAKDGRVQYFHDRSVLKRTYFEL